MAPPNPAEVLKVLDKLLLPGRLVQNLIDQGFTSLEDLCSLGRESDFMEAGMNKVQARRLAAALKPGGWIFDKLQKEGRFTSETKHQKEETESPRETHPTSPRPEKEGTSIPLMCYPAGSPSSRCLLFGTLVQVSKDTFAPVEALRPHRDFVLTPKGRLSVLALTVESKWRWLVQLEAGAARLTVTDSHRIVCIKDGSSIDKFAGKLNEGDVVQTSQGDYELSSVKHFYAEAKVVELTLSPDEAFEAVYAPTAILSKGKARYAACADLLSTLRHVQGVILTCFQIVFRLRNDNHAIEPETR